MATTLSRVMFRNQYRTARCTLKVFSDLTTTPSHRREAEAQFLALPEHVRRCLSGALTIERDMPGFLAPASLFAHRHGLYSGGYFQTQVRAKLAAHDPARRLAFAFARVGGAR